MTQIVLLDLVDIDSVISNLTVSYVIETIDKIGYCRLSCTGRSDKRDLLTRCSIKIDIVKNRMSFFICKVDVMELNITFKFNICCSSVRLVEMFPSPHSRSFFTLSKLTVDHLGIDQGNITFVSLRNLIQKIEDPLSACKTNHDRIKLH